MGRTNGKYNSEFPVGTIVRIADTADLEKFSRNWKYHHPLQAEQLQFGGKQAKVLNVTFYHGGDELYELSGTPKTKYEDRGISIRLHA